MATGMTVAPAEERKACQGLKRAAAAGGQMPHGGTRPMAAGIARCVLPRLQPAARAWRHAPHGLLVRQLGSRIEVLLRLDAQAREREEERGGRAGSIAARRCPACCYQSAGG
jgi:hypothetical protein